MRPVYLVVAIAILLLELAGVQMLFLLIQQKQGLEIQTNLVRQFPHPPEQDALLIELTQLSREGEIRCFQYSEAPKAYMPWSEKNCESSPWWLKAASIDAEILGANGKIWKVRFRPVNHRSFYVALWLMRALVVFSAFGWIIFPRFVAKKAKIVQRKTGP